MLATQQRINLLIGMASNQDTHEIATNTSNLHLTSRVRVQLDSSLQGHLKALSKLIRSTEIANHHTELFQAATDTKRPLKFHTAHIPSLLNGRIHYRKLDSF